MSEDKSEADKLVRENEALRRRITAFQADACHAEQELRQSEERFSKVFRTSPYAITIIRAEDGKFIDVNDAFFTIFGFTREEALADSSIGLKLWVDEEDRKRVLSALGEGQAVTDQEFSFRKKNGAIITGLFSAQVIQLVSEPCILSTINDITLRKRGEDALNASETRYRRLFEAAKDGILILDADTGKIVDVNSYLTELTGYLHEDFLGKHLWEIGSFKDIAASMDSFAELSSKKYVRYENLPLETRDGRKIDVEFVSNIYRADNQNVIQCNIRNITARKRAEKQIRSQLEELQRWQDVMLEREDRVQELKREVNELCSRQGDATRYLSQETGQADTSDGKWYS